MKIFNAIFIFTIVSGKTVGQQFGVDRENANNFLADNQVR